jgi:hypothetical protein
LWFSDPGAFQNDTEAEKMFISVGRTISQVVGMPASYVSVGFADSRRLTAATRQLTGGILEVEYSIYVPADSVAEYPGIDVAEASLNSVNVSAFTSLLQENIDSVFGDAVHSVSVLAIEAVVVDESSTTTAEDHAIDHAIPAESDGAQSSASGLLIIIVVGTGCCLGSLFVILALFLRRRRRRALRMEGDPASSAGAGDDDKSEFIFDMDHAGDTDAGDSPQVTIPSEGLTPRLRGPSGGGDQVPEDGDGLEFVFGQPGCIRRRASPGGGSEPERARPEVAQPAWRRRPGARRRRRIGVCF